MDLGLESIGASCTRFGFPERSFPAVHIAGRLDATTVTPPPRAAAIPRIAFDHQDKLGDTLQAIAREKAGIAKPGVDVILGPMPPEVEAAIAEVARSVGATTSRARE